MAKRTRCASPPERREVLLRSRPETSARSMTSSSGSGCAQTPATSESSSRTGTSSRSVPFWSIAPTRPSWAAVTGAVPHTSTYALTNVTLPYAVELANRGWRSALQGDAALALGLNTHAGALIGLVVPGVAIEDIATTSKTLPQFPELWSALAGGV